HSQYHFGIGPRQVGPGDGREQRSRGWDDAKGIRRHDVGEAETTIDRARDRPAKPAGVFEEHFGTHERVAAQSMKAYSDVYGYGRIRRDGPSTGGKRHDTREYGHQIAEVPS